MSEIFRHKKSGGLYVVLDDEIRIEATNSRGVLYKSLMDGTKWVRPYSEFHDGRFEKLNSMEYSTGVVKLSARGDF